jgi:hypothetical protein
MAIFFVCVPLTIIAGLVIGIISSVVVQRRGSAGFLMAQGWALLILCVLASLLGGLPYPRSDKPPRLDAKRLDVQFELRAPG